jgi:hypothetical protein
MLHPFFIYSIVRVRASNTIHYKKFTRIADVTFMLIELFIVCY